MPKKYYEILGVAETASEAEIRTAYRQLSLKYHPDKVATSGLTVKQATEKMQEINEACEVLMNPEKRVHYDRRGDNENDDTNDTSSSTDGLFDLKNFKELVIYLMTCHIGQNGISDEELKKSGFDFYNEDIRDKKSHREVADYIWLYRNWAESQEHETVLRSPSEIQEGSEENNDLDSEPTNEDLEETSDNEEETENSPPPHSDGKTF
ncbi:34918_t:CDS:2 [Racocetra persica]|uniref:34918_t:CDS:1 n=1 Tax=Racocetra persica TaxID=160502 RepID=A0ACA9NF81_9GLOM|nr:34918_t:CDS:2 [Racocetra persica]